MAEGGFKLKVGLTPECLSEIPVSVETLSEQGTGTRTRVVKEGFLEDGMLREISTGEGSEA